MLLRKIIIFLVVSLFCGVLAVFIMQNYSPFQVDKINEIIVQNQIEVDMEELLDLQIQQIINSGRIFEYLTPQVYGAVILISISVTLFFASIHLSIDKLFFKKFYENPSTFIAIRRGVIIILSFWGFVVLRLYTIDSLTASTAFIVGALVEIGFLLFWMDRQRR